MTSQRVEQLAAEAEGADSHEAENLAAHMGIANEIVGLALDFEVDLDRLTEKLGPDIVYSSHPDSLPVALRAVRDEIKSNHGND